MEQLKMFFKDINSEAAKCNALQPTQTYSTAVSSVKTQNTELRNRESNPTTLMGSPSTIQPLLPSVTGTSTPVLQSLESEQKPNKKQPKHKVGGTRTWLHSTGRLQATERIVRTYVGYIDLSTNWYE